MKIPCAKYISFVISGLAFLKPELSNIQFQNLTLIASAIILGAKFNLTEISRMWLKEKCISTLSHFLSDAKFCTSEMQHLYALHALSLYKIKKGFFIIDDTMKHHTKFCKWIHGVFVLFDHALNTNLKATCIVFLYFYDGESVKFPIDFRIFYQAESKMKWYRSNRHLHKTKYKLAIEMLEWAINNEFPKCLVLADSWYGIEPFIKELKRLKLSYVLEIKVNYTVRVPYAQPKLTSKGKLTKKQYDAIPLPEYFKSIISIAKCGFAAHKEEGKIEKVLYHAKTVTVQLNSVSGMHRIVESVDPTNQTTKYLLTDQLTWEATKILSSYENRWVIEEFFRNAKQLSDMEGATIRSEQGVTLSLCLVSWIDFLLHHENYKQRTAGKLTKESLTIPSIVRQAQYENLLSLLDRIQKEENFVQKWLEVEGQCIKRNRKKHNKLITLEEVNREQIRDAA